MKFPLVPAYYFSDIYAIDLARLRARGVKLLLADLDNTLVPYGVTEPPEEIVAWKQALEAQPPGPGLEGRPGSGGDHPVHPLQQPSAGPGPAVRPGPGGAL